jgi:hypothetical protein
MNYLRTAASVVANEGIFCLFIGVRIWRKEYASGKKNQ